MRRVLTQSMLAAVLVSTLGAAPSLHDYTVKRITPKLEAKPQAKPYKLRDRDSMYLRVSASGSKIWKFD